MYYNYVCYIWWSTNPRIHPCRGAGPWLEPREAGMKYSTGNNDVTGPVWGDPQVVKALETGLEKTECHFYSGTCSCMDKIICVLCYCLGVCIGSK